MASRRMHLSEEGKVILDDLMEKLEVERPMVIKISLAKGIASSEGLVTNSYLTGKNKWTIPDGVIKDKELTLFEHLIINEIKQTLNQDELHKYLMAYIEIGLREIEKIIQQKNSMEDIRIAIM